MDIVKKLWAFLISMKLMVVLILIFATASGVATFIENDHGINTSWAVVYSSTWFEAVQVLLGISILGNIFKFKMHKKAKWPVLIFHVGFIVVLVGSAITRYYGYEGVMHIREGKSESRMLSSDAFLQISATKDSKEYYDEDIVYISEMGGKKFNNTLDVDGKKLVVKYKDFIGSAVKTLVEDPNGQPMVSFVISTPQGPEEYFLKSGESIDVGPLAVFFDKQPVGNKPILSIFRDRGETLFASNVNIDWLKMSDQTKGVYEATNVYKFEEKKMYNINGIQLVSKNILDKASVKVISEDEKASKMQMKTKSMSALIVDVSYAGETHEVALMGQGKRYKGYTEYLNIDGAEISLEWGAKIIEVPFSLHLRDFILVKYPGSMSPSSYESDVTVIDNINSVKEDYKIYMNNVLDYGGFLFFQSSYDQDELGTILSVNHDPGKWPTYLGYFLLSLGLFLNFFNKKSYFGKLASKKYEYKASVLVAMVALATVLSTQPLYASNVDESKLNNIDLDHANHYGTILVQGYDGRIKPLDTLAIDLVNKVSGRDSMFGMNHNQVILAMSSNPMAWKQVEMIKVSHPKLKKILGLKEDQKLFKYASVFNEYGEYILGPIAEEALRMRPAERGKYEKDVIKVDERVNIAYMIYSGRFLKAFPLDSSEDNKWHFPEESVQLFSGSQKEELFTILRENSSGLYAGINDGDWDAANRGVDSIKAFQEKYGEAIIPNSSVINAEILYNNLKIFDRLYPIYLIAGLFLLVFIFIRLARPELSLSTIMRVIFVITVLAFIAHTISLGLRWYVSGHAPWSNGYEAMLYISWTTILSGLIFARSSDLAMATTSIFAGVTLFVAHLSWLDPQIGTMVPVLKSYWLTIHVSIITASYGFLGLSTLLGFVTLIFYIMLNDESKRERISVNILESTRISEMSMYVGLALLTIGNFLGGVWANESWGRYWGWDPKETWALVTILVYVFMVHMRFVPVLRSNFIFNALSVVAYSSVIMTYFGVNYYLSGLHSYAAGDPVPVPEWIYYVVTVIAVLIVWASFNRNKLINVKPVKN